MCNEFMYQFVYVCVPFSLVRKGVACPSLESFKKRIKPMLCMMHYAPQDPGPDDLLKSVFDL